MRREGYMLQPCICSNRCSVKNTCCNQGCYGDIQLSAGPVCVYRNFTKILLKDQVTLTGHGTVQHYWPCCRLFPFSTTQCSSLYLSLLLLMYPALSCPTLCVCSMGEEGGTHAPLCVFAVGVEREALMHHFVCLQ